MAAISIFSSEEDKDRYQANLSAEEDSLPVPQSVRGKPSPLSKLAIRIKWVDSGRRRRRGAGNERHAAGEGRAAVSWTCGMAGMIGREVRDTSDIAEYAAVCHRAVLRGKERFELQRHDGVEASLFVSSSPS